MFPKSGVRIGKAVSRPFNSLMPDNETKGIEDTFRRFLNADEKRLKGRRIRVELTVEEMKLIEFALEAYERQPLVDGCV